MTKFIPDDKAFAQAKVPYFEHVKAADIPGKHTRKSLSTLQSEIIDYIAKLGGDNVRFISGKFAHEVKNYRYGYQLSFYLNGTAGIIKIAALPLLNDTPERKDRALAQCLFLVRDWFAAELHSAAYRPNSNPLIPYLIGPQGKSIMETVFESGTIPMLGSGSGDVIEGEFHEQ